MDGQTVTNLAAEVAKRERAIEGYLTTRIRPRAAMRFPQRAESTAAWNWFRNNPVGFNGVPFVLFKIDSGPRPQPQQSNASAIARIWETVAVVPAGAGASADVWTLDHIGVRPSMSDYVNGVARPINERLSPLPFGFAFENPRSFQPLTATETAAYDARLLARRVFENTSLLIAKLRTADKEENWERDRPSFGSPGGMDRVFFSCAACHVGRVLVAGKMKSLVGMPNTEIETQYYRSCSC